MTTENRVPDEVGGCAMWLAPDRLPIPALDDEEGAHLPESLPPVVDAHVHLFPDAVFEAIWRWFEQHAWEIRYPLKTPEVIRFLLSRGVERIVALHYAHRPGISRGLNRYMSEIALQHPEVLGLGTVLPGEPEAVNIVEEAFESGLRGLKLHCHVQSFAPDSEEMEEIYRACVRSDMPLVMHAGREPRSEAYPVDTHTICSAERVAAVLTSFPGLRLCVPHLGVDELDEYGALLERHDNLWLDTTMAVGEFFPVHEPHSMIAARPERILYGTDFPNLPYAWDREIRLLAQAHDEETLAAVLGETARGFFGL